MWRKFSSFCSSSDLLTERRSLLGGNLFQIPKKYPITESLYYKTEMKIEFFFSILRQKGTFGLKKSNNTQASYEE